MHTGNKPKIITPPPGPKALEVIHKDNVLLSPSLSRSAPLVGVETQGVWVKDIDDNIFLDFGSGIAVANVSHRHPEVVQAIIRQVQLCDHVNSCDYYTLPQIHLARARLRLAPPLILTHEQADSGLQIIEKVIDTVEKNSQKT